MYISNTYVLQDILHRRVKISKFQCEAISLDETRYTLEPHKNIHKNYRRIYNTTTFIYYIQLLRHD